MAKSVTTVEQTRNKLVNSVSRTNLALGDNEWITGSYTDSGAGSTISEGALMGRIQATQKLVLCDPAAVDGSEYPVGVAMEEVEVSAGATVTLTLINKGRVAKDELSLKSGVALTDEVGDRTLEDQIEILGISLKGGTELTNYDNV